MPHHGSRRNLGPSVLDRLFGKPRQIEAKDWTAFISAAADGAPKHPHKKITNALRRRGAGVYVTAGKNIKHSYQAPRERDGGPSNQFRSTQMSRMTTPKWDTYTTYARLFPGVLAAVPLIVLWFMLSSIAGWKELFTFVMGVKVVGMASIRRSFSLFYARFVRITSKWFEARYFKDTKGFPTTYFMLYTDGTYSRDLKDRFRERVTKTLRIDLPARATNRATGTRREND